MTEQQIVLIVITAGSSPEMHKKAEHLRNIRIMEHVNGAPQPLMPEKCGISAATLWVFLGALLGYWVRSQC
jgi:hypothetical protein